MYFIVFPSHTSWTLCLSKKIARNVTTKWLKLIQPYYLCKRRYFCNI